MKLYQKSVLFSFLILSSVAGLVLPFIALADATPSPSSAPSPYGNRDMNAPIDVNSAYRLPEVYATNLSITKNGQNISGSFTAFNNGDYIVGGLQYDIEILGTDGALYDKFPIMNQFSLNAKEKRTISFSYALGQLPKDTYNLRIQIVTNGGRELGWSDKSFTITQGSNSFVKIVSGAIKLPNFPGQIFDPLSGPNVSPKETFSLAVELQNNGAVISATPVFDVYSFDIARGNKRTVTLSPIILQAKERKIVTLLQTADQKSGVYYALLHLTDSNGNTISSMGEYRWVVTGVSADIMPVKISHLATTQGDTTVMNLDVVGAPDALTVFNANITAQISDAKGIVGQAHISNIKLTDMPTETITRIQLKRDLVSAPTITLTITDMNASILSSNSFTMNIDQSQFKKVINNNFTWFVILGIVGLILLIFLLKYIYV